MKLIAGDRVRVYSTYGGYSECPPATVVDVFGDEVILVRLDWYRDDEGRRVKDSSATAYVHRGQCRKLRPKNKSGTV